MCVSVSTFHFSVIQCAFGVVAGRTEITCTTNKPLFLPPVCTIDGISIPDCEMTKSFASHFIYKYIFIVFIGNISNIVVTTQDFNAGNLTLTIEAVDVEEVSATVTFDFVLIG